MKKDDLKFSFFLPVLVFVGIFAARIVLAHENEVELEGHEIIALIHGTIGLFILLGLAAVLGGLWQANEKGFLWIKKGAIVLTVSSILLWASGVYLYTVYRAPDGPKFEILAGARPWVHDVMMEMKEFTGAFVPIILSVMLAVVLTYDKNIISDKKARMMFVALLALAVLWTMLTFGLGAFITKTAPL